MDERVSSPLVINWRAAGSHESDVFVKADCLQILLVHSGLNGRQGSERMGHQRSANALAMKFRINE